jgi:SAM-dependent methyltransferase
MLLHGITQLVPASLRRTLKKALMALPSRRIYQRALAGKRGIEIGGPSSIFATIIPVYQIVGDLDGANFSANTIWEGSITEGRTYNYHGKRTGTQYVVEAANLSGIADHAYDFVLSSNCLEHCANPLKALKEWTRVIDKGGSVLLVLPDKQSNFDHKRPVTSFAHLVKDYEDDTQEDDLTHLPEILELHDLTRDPPAGTPEEFAQRSRNNLQNRTLHHHVFDQDLMAAMFGFVGLELVQADTANGNFIALGMLK